MLSKSKFILGQQCHKSLWLNANGIKPTNPPDDSSKERLSAGNEVGEEAKKLFPGGVEIPFIIGNDGFNKMCDLTRAAIKSGNHTIYEASFIKEGIFIRVDIMHLSPEGWDIYEVKSSSGLRPYHKEDASLQWYVLDKVIDLELNDIYVITLNNKYYKKGDIDPTKLFTLNHLSSFVLSNQINVKDELDKILDLANSDIEPEIQIGSHCKKPHSCEYLDRCWPKNTKDLNSVFRLYRLNTDKKLSLYNQGIDTFEKLDPSIKLSSTQLNQIKAYEISEPIINKIKINSFIEAVNYPISYFDFETFTDAVPIYDGQRAHMQMPFQYSLHIQNSENSEHDELAHYEFIADINKDPRRAIAESLLKNLPKSGTIMAYNQSFEISRIKDLAEHFPDIAPDLLKLNGRFLDLIIPFRGGGYYHHDFGGGFSIKKVLPALCADDKRLDYKKLDISNGGMASAKYKQMRSQSKEEISLTRKKLFDYCWLDTYAMYAIYSKLQDCIK
jgi:hypothetical protein